MKNDLNHQMVGMKSLKDRAERDDQTIFIPLHSFIFHAENMTNGSMFLLFHCANFSLSLSVERSRNFIAHARLHFVKISENTFFIDFVQ